MGRYARRFLLFQALVVGLSCSARAEEKAAEESGKKVSPQTGDAEAAKVRKTMKNYQLALAQTDGKAAAGLVTNGTIKLFQEHRDLALKGSKEQVQKLSLANKMQVLLIRHRVSVEKLREMDGTKVFAYAVDNGWFGKKALTPELGKISVVGPRATASILVNGQEGGVSFHFINQDDQWKLDLTHTMKLTDALLGAQLRRSGLEEDQAIFLLIESVSGTKVPDTIWEPLEK